MANLIQGSYRFIFKKQVLFKNLRCILYVLTCFDIFFFKSQLADLWWTLVQVASACQVSGKRNNPENEPNQFYVVGPSAANAFLWILPIGWMAQLHRWTLSWSDFQPTLGGCITPLFWSLPCVLPTDHPVWIFEFLNLQGHRKQYNLSCWFS